ncbi:MAG: NADP-dependent oxidoreductase [Kangiellaceae bacterium]|nr:NADP-dependent oxidoreductase [Kangiellaceae bacterium]
MQNTQVKLVKRPSIKITSDIFEISEEETPQLSEGQFLVKQTHMSLDPAMRGWMEPDTTSYIPPVDLGAVMRSSGVGEVIESSNSDFPIGTMVAGMFGWQQYAVCDAKSARAMPPGLPAEAILSVLALPGITAYQGLFNVIRPKSGETIAISGAAGSVGSLVGQMAKVEGLRVIGFAGSDDKCAWLKEIGFDEAINYHSDNLDQLLASAAPDGIDCYFENTGGAVQHAVFNQMNAFGRIAVCGMIADYNTDKPSAGPNWINIIKKRLKIQGFTMPDHQAEWPNMAQKMGAYLMQGQIQYRTHIIDGLENAIEGINLLFSGGNKGKLIVKL